MDKKSLLATASAAALAAAASAQPAAGGQQVLQPITLTAQVETASESEADPLVRFTLLTRGDFSPASVERALMATFPQLGEAQAVAVPAFLARLSRLSLTATAHRAAEDAAILLLSAANISDAVFYSVARAVAGGDGDGLSPYRLAQNAAGLNNADDGLCERARNINVREAACDPPQSYLP